MFILKGICIVITVYVGLLFVLGYFIYPGALFTGMYFLTGDISDKPEDGIGKIPLIWFISNRAVTAFAMATAELCAFVMRPKSTNVHPCAPLHTASAIIQPAVCSVGFIVNNIPFFTLNLSIILIMVVQMVTNVFFEFSSPFWLNASVLVTTIFVTNKGARGHVALRLRQRIDSFTNGGNVHPIVEIALVPLRSLAGSAPTLPTSTSAGPALVRFSNPLPRANGLENLTRPAPRG